MKIPTFFILLTTACCLLGCSKKSSSSGQATASSQAETNAGPLIPETAAEIANSPNFKLNYTTKSGAKVYVRTLTREVADAIPSDSPARRYLVNRPVNKPFLVMAVHGDQIAKLTLAEIDEVNQFNYKQRQQRQAATQQPTP